MNFMIEKNPSELKEELGNIIEINKENADEYIPEGKNYIIYDYDLDMGVKLFKNNKFYLIEEWNEDTKYKVIRKNEIDRIENLIEASFQEIVILTNEGWTPKTNNEDFLNLTPYMEKLNTYMKIKNILIGKINEEE